MRVPISSAVSFALPLMVAVLAATPALACSARAAAGDTIAGPVLEVPAAGVKCVMGAEGRGHCRLDGADVVSLAQTPTVQQAALSWR